MLKKLIQTDEHAGMMIVRLTLGIVMFPHGAQKLLGWFGGSGFAATMKGMTGMGMPAALVILVIAVEFLGSLSLIFGFLSRLSALGLHRPHAGRHLHGAPAERLLHELDGPPERRGLRVPHPRHRHRAGHPRQRQRQPLDRPFRCRTSPGTTCGKEAPGLSAQRPRAHTVECGCATQRSPLRSEVGSDQCDIWYVIWAGLLSNAESAIPSCMHLSYDGNDFLGRNSQVNPLNVQGRGFGNEPVRSRIRSHLGA